MLEDDTLPTYCTSKESRTTTQQFDDNSTSLVQYSLDQLDTKDFFANFDLDEIGALENGDLSLLNDTQKIQHLTTTSTIIKQQQQQFDNTQFSANIDMFSNNNNNNSDSLKQQYLNNNNNNDNLVLDCNNTNNSGCIQPPLPPVVISPSEIDSITIQLEKNQQCACKDCGKLFNSVWYLKQHAVKHSNDRPFKCKFCMKTYKFRSNLYQHKCPERSRYMGGQSFSKRLYTRGVAYIEMYGNKNSNGVEMPLSYKSSNKKQLKDALSTNGFSTSTITTTNSSSGLKNLNIITSENSNAIFENSTSSAYTNENYMMKPNNSYEMSQQYPIMDSLFYENNISASNNSDFTTDFNNIAMSSNFQGNMFQTTTTSTTTTTINSNNSTDFQINDFQLSYNNNIQNMVDFNCIREKQLSQEYIDEYLLKNRNRVYSCRKCKLTFPTREYLSRHCAYHSTMDSKPFVCEQCPMRYVNEKQLSNHLLQHSDNSPHRCNQCGGTFRSALALRRHKEQCRQCYYPPFGIQPKLIISPSAPLDQYSYVESEDEIEQEEEEEESDLTTTTSTTTTKINKSFTSNLTGEIKNLAMTQNVTRKITSDSGIGSDCSTYSYGYNNSSSPPTNSMSYEAQHVQHLKNLHSNLQHQQNSSKQLLYSKRSLELEEEDDEDDEEEDEEAEVEADEDEVENNNKNENNKLKIKSSEEGTINAFTLAQQQDENSMKKFDDETDSGFRSRLNSSATAQSCSPPSTSSASTSSSSTMSSSDSGSPSHKISTTSTQQQQQQANNKNHNSQQNSHGNSSSSKNYINQNYSCSFNDFDNSNDDDDEDNDETIRHMDSDILCHIPFRIGTTNWRRRYKNKMEVNLIDSSLMLTSLNSTMDWKNQIYTTETEEENLIINLEFSSDYYKNLKFIIINNNFHILFGFLKKIIEIFWRGFLNNLFNYIIIQNELKKLQNRNYLKESRSIIRIPICNSNTLFKNHTTICILLKLILILAKHQTFIDSNNDDILTIYKEIDSDNKNL